MSKGEQTRQSIIEQAAPLFNRRGYAGCSLNEIMEATGLCKGGIYRHFDSKEELAAEAFDFAWKTVYTRRRQGMDNIANHVDRLKRHVANFAHETGFPGGCPVLNTAVDADDGNTVLRDRVRAALRNWRAMIVAIVEEGQRAGTVRPDVDASRVATRIITALEGASLLSRIERNSTVLPDTLTQLDFYLETQVRPAAELSTRTRRPQK